MLFKFKQTRTLASPEVRISVLTVRLLQRLRFRRESTIGRNEHKTKQFGNWSGIAAIYEQNKKREHALSRGPTVRLRVSADRSSMSVRGDGRPQLIF